MKGQWDCTGPTRGQKLVKRHIHPINMHAGHSLLTRLIYIYIHLHIYERRVISTCEYRHDTDLFNGAFIKPIIML